MAYIWRWFLSPKHGDHPPPCTAAHLEGHTTSPFRCIISNAIQGDLRGKVSVVGGDSTGNCDRKNRMNVCLFQNVYAQKAVRISRPDSIRFSFVRHDKKRILKDRNFQLIQLLGCDVRDVKHIIN